MLEDISKKTKTADARKVRFLGSVLPPYVAFLCVCLCVVSQFLIVLIGFQTANKNHSKSREVAVRVTMYVFTNRYQVQYERTLFLTPSWRQEQEWE